MKIKKQAPSVIAKIMASVVIFLMMLILMFLLSSCEPSARHERMIKAAAEKANTSYIYNDTMRVGNRRGQMLLGLDTVPVYNTHGVYTGILILRYQTNLSNVLERLPDHKIVADTIKVVIVKDLVNWNL